MAKNRNEYMRQYQRTLRAELRTEDVAKRRLRRAWNAEGREAHCVYWTPQGPSWGRVDRVPPGAVVILSRINMPTARAVAATLQRMVPRPPRPRRVGVVRVDASGGVIHYPNMAAAARANEMCRVALFRAVYVGADACAECRGYPDYTDFAKFAGCGGCTT